jgi:hypothetical protein
MVVRVARECEKSAEVPAGGRAECVVDLGPDRFDGLQFVGS